MNKSDLRKVITEKKLLMTESEIQVNSDKLTEIFLNSDYYKNYSVIYAYISYNQEVITDNIVRQAWKDGKKVAIPKIFNKQNMAFCYIDSLSDLSPGYAGILEPNTENIAIDKDALVLMPGLVYDYERNRIGYGQGFYDKYLSRNAENNFFKVSLCFDFQIVESIETEEHDEKVDIIITPTQIIK